MLDQAAELTNFEDSELLPYGNDLINADDRSTLNQLMRMYPNVLEIVEIDTETRRYILDRTLHHMLHLDKVFNMEQTFDHVHYDMMKAEAIAYIEWLDSPDGTPLPDILKYKMAGPVIEEPEAVKPASSDMEPMQADHPQRERSKRGPSGNSAYQRALIVYNEDVAANKSRASTLERFNKELGIALKTGNVYYSKFKHPVKAK